MKKLFVWGTVLSGVGAAYLMYRRGVPILKVVKSAMANPVGTLITELKTAL